jgi:hypothetical protein
MNAIRKIIGTILVMLLAVMAGCSGSDNNADKSGSLTGSGK